MIEDYESIKQSLTMQQVAESYGFHPDSKGFIRCPFHGNGSERTPSLKLYPGQRGFHCKGCGVGGDIIKFVSILNGIDNWSACQELAERFGIQLVEQDGVEISEEVQKRATKARLEREQRIALEEQKRMKLRQINTLITAYRNIMKEENRMSDVYAYCYRKCQYLCYLQELLCLEVYRK